MARTRRLWISDVIAQGSDRFPAPVLGNRRLRLNGSSGYPAVWTAPNCNPQTGEAVTPRIFIGVAYADDAEMTVTQDEATAVGARFRQMQIRLQDLDVALTGAQRTAINQILTSEGMAAVSTSETRRQALRRLGRLLDIGRDEVLLLRELNAHGLTSPEDMAG